jgi:hypothetical protein
MLPIKPSAVKKFLTYNPISSKHMPLWSLFLDQHLTIPHSIIGLRSGLITPKFHGKYMNYGGILRF